MSYRDDHDAALSRIDALEAELGKNDDARARFSTLEQQLATAKAERDRMREALANQEGRRGSLLMPVLLGSAALVLVGGFALAVHSARSDQAAMPAPAPVAPLGGLGERLSARTEVLMKCVAQLDAAVRSRSAIGADCRASIKEQASDTTLGPDIHSILSDWYAAETMVAMNPEAIAQRDALVTRIHDYVIPSYTR